MDLAKLDYDMIPRHSDKVKLHFSKENSYTCSEHDRPLFPLLEEVFESQIIIYFKIIKSYIFYRYPDTLINVELKNTS